MFDNKKNLFAILALFAAASIFFLFRGSERFSFDLSDTSFSVGGPEDFVWSIPYEGIDGVELRESFDLGVCVSGGTKSGYSYGTWENDELGRYQLCIQTKISHVILIRSNVGEPLVFNCESDDTTEKFYNSLADYLAGRVS